MLGWVGKVMSLPPEFVELPSIFGFIVLKGVAGCELEFAQILSLLSLFLESFIYDTSHGGGDRIPQKADEEALRPVI